MKSPTISSAFRAVLLAMAVLAAPGMHPAAALAVDLELWTMEEEPERMATIRYLADCFMAVNDDVHVYVVAVNENELAQTYAQAAAAGKAPELVNAGSDVLVDFSAKGWLDNGLATEAAADIGRDRFYQGTLDMLRMPGVDTLHALPFHGWVQGVWYRADWFREKGLEPPDSLERILAAARALHDPDKGVWGLLVGTKRDGYAEQCFTHLALAQGIRLFDEQGRLVFDEPRTVRLLEAYRELAAYTPEGPQTWRARDFYLQGHLAMMFYSTFIMDDLALPGAAANSLTGDNFEQLDGAPFDPGLLGRTGMIPVIKGSRRASYGVLAGIGFRQGMSPVEIDAAVRFTQFLYRSDCYVTWLQMAPGGMLPVLRDIATTGEFYRDMGGVFRRYGHNQVRRIIAGLEDVGSFSMENGRLNAKAAGITTAGIIPNMIHKALFGGVPPAQAVSWAAQEMRKIN